MLSLRLIVGTIVFFVAYIAVIVWQLGEAGNAVASFSARPNLSTEAAPRMALPAIMQTSSVIGVPGPILALAPKAKIEPVALPLTDKAMKADAVPWPPRRPRAVVKKKEAEVNVVTDPLRFFFPLLFEGKGGLTFGEKAN